jgi:hypothetical protein
MSYLILSLLALRACMHGHDAEKEESSFQCARRNEGEWVFDIQIIDAFGSFSMTGYAHFR